jgi:hypothetical protein
MCLPILVLKMSMNSRAGPLHPAVMHSKNQHIPGITIHMAKCNCFREEILDFDRKDNMEVHQDVDHEHQYDGVVSTYCEVV